MEKTFDVIVVGAGPGGSSIAALLSRSGVSTLLLDKACFPRDKVCGDGLTPRALYWLERDEALLDQRRDVFVTDRKLKNGGHWGFSFVRH